MTNENKLKSLIESLKYFFPNVEDMKTDLTLEEWFDQNIKPITQPQPAAEAGNPNKGLMQPCKKQ